MSVMFCMSTTSMSVYECSYRMPSLFPREVTPIKISCADLTIVTKPDREQNQIQILMYANHTHDLEYIREEGSEDRFDA